MPAQPDGDPAPPDGALPDGLDWDRPLRAYVHVPFCTVRCGYCDFNTYTAGELGGFDVDGYVSALRRVRDRSVDVVVPRFDRMLEAAIAGSIRIATTTELVVTEGNYLLLQDDPWRAVRPLLDEAWLIEADPVERVEQLVSRHVHHGRDRAAAEAWVHEVDEVNARLITERSIAIDLVVRR